MLADVAKADIVFVGEQHDDPNTHRLEAAILDGLRRRGVPVTLVARDVRARHAGGLDSYLAGKASPKRSSSRRRGPGRDTRPTTGRSSRWPRRRAGRSSPRTCRGGLPRASPRPGLTALETLTPAERAWVAADMQCPRDAYFERFAADDGHQEPDHDATGPRGDAAGRHRGRPAQTTERYYFSQCVKDETMAEAIAAGIRASRPQARRPRQRAHSTATSD